MEIQPSSSPWKGEAPSANGQNCRPRGKEARLRLPQPKAQEESGKRSKETNEETAESSATEAKSRLQQMEERRDEKDKVYLPFPALAGPRNEFLRPLRISSKENAWYGCKIAMGKKN